MSKLVVYNEGKREAEYLLDKERVTIGRRSDNDIRLGHNAVSGEHALVITIRNDSFLEDLHSTNGVRVNNRPIKKCALQDGDEIRIAHYLLKYVYEPVALADEMDELTLLLEPERAQQPTRPPAAATSAADEAPTRGLGGVVPETGESGPGRPSALPPAKVHILSGAGAGRELALDKTLTTLGKPGIQMALITRRARGYFLTHVEGPDFPLLNGSPIGPHSHALNDRDIVELAGIKLEFSMGRIGESPDNPREQDPARALERSTPG